MPTIHAQGAGAYIVNAAKFKSHLSTATSTNPRRKVVTGTSQPKRGLISIKSVNVGDDHAGWRWCLPNGPNAVNVQ